MRNSKKLLLYCTVIFVGIVTVSTIRTVSAEEEWTKSFEAFKPADDPKFHQRNTGVVNWGLYHEQSNEGKKSWINRIKDAEGQSRLSYQKPANLADEKYQAPCPLCKQPTYFWLDSGHVDAETVRLIKLDYPKWKKDCGVCRFCFEGYAIKSGTWYDGNLASTTDIYTIGFNKSDRVLEYFKHVK